MVPFFSDSFFLPAFPGPRYSSGYRQPFLRDPIQPPLEIQVIGSLEKERGKESLVFDYLAAMSQKALSSAWMKEKIRLISKVCENTVMGIDNLTTRRLSASIRKTDARELCLYRVSVWCSMSDDGSPRYSIRDIIDPVFTKDDPAAGKRAAEAGRLAGMVMGEEVWVQENSWDLNAGQMKKWTSRQ